jgi:hypothetical protein
MKIINLGKKKRKDADLFLLSSSPLNNSRALFLSSRDKHRNDEKKYILKKAVNEKKSISFSFLAHFGLDFSTLGLFNHGIVP